MTGIVTEAKSAFIITNQLLYAISIYKSVVLRGNITHYPSCTEYITHLMLSIVVACNGVHDRLQHYSFPNQIT